MIIRSLNQKANLFAQVLARVRAGPSLSGETNRFFFTDSYGNFTHEQVDALSSHLSKDLTDLLNANNNDLKGQKVAVLCSNNYTYLTSIMAVWKANGVPLGLNKLYPPKLIEYFINDTKCKLVINGVSKQAANDKQNQELDVLLDQLKVANYKIDESLYMNKASSSADPSADGLMSFRKLFNNEKSKEAIILYTSGTSGPPKGVVLTFNNLLRTIETLIDAWKLDSSNCLLHTLPLNHVHGLIYALLAVKYAGGKIDMLPKFNAHTVWSKLLGKDNHVNTLMAVPTIYVQLVNAFLNDEELKKAYNQDYVKSVFKKKIKLVVSGSAPLNVKTYKEWNDITGYRILERYGMTEIGLGLSNELAVEKRIAGAVGRPFGNTYVRIFDSDKVLIESHQNGDKIHSNEGSLFGELQIKGDMVFKEYLGKPKETKESFTDDGWFKTGET
jgi:malonyl-CoA/methylmalonyl-CoA synthetase